MKKLGITHSATVDSIELDGLRRIVCSFHSTNEETRERMLKIFTGYNASDEKQVIMPRMKTRELLPMNIGCGNLRPNSLSHSLKKK